MHTGKTAEEDLAMHAHCITIGTSVSVMKACSHAAYPKQPGRSKVSSLGRNSLWCFSVPSLAMVPAQA